MTARSGKASAAQIENAGSGSGQATHLETLLQHDINLIRAKLMEMGALDERALTAAFHGFLRCDRQLAYSVILRDQEIDALETMLDRLCLEFIVRHQPAAGNLRFVYSASKIVNLLERVGDYAESIARQTLLLSSTPYELPPVGFQEIAGLALPMLHDAVHAFVNKDAELARRTMAIEPRVNDLRDSLTSELVRRREAGSLPLEALTPLITIARRFERVSDQATNICEQALYFATGEYLRHMPSEGYRVVFVDRENACLSRIAEAAAAGLGIKRFTFESAGLRAAPVEPKTVGFFARRGIPAPAGEPKTIEQIERLDHVQVIVALSKEAIRAFPETPRKTACLEWAIPDPSLLQGTEEEIHAAYEDAFQSLKAHIRELAQAILGEDELNQPRLP